MLGFGLANELWARSARRRWLRLVGTHAANGASELCKRQSRALQVTVVAQCCSSHGTVAQMKGATVRTQGGRSSRAIHSWRGSVSSNP